MKKVIGIVLGALACSLAATAFAADPGDEASDRLTRLGATDGNVGMLFNASGTWGGSRCENKSAILVDLSTEGGRQMYHTALAAHLAGQPIKAFWSACRTLNTVTYPLASRIDVIPN